MKRDTIIEKLEERGVRATATRILIFQYVIEQQHTFSLSNICEALPSIDKSTIFRTLILFEKHNFIYSLEDGSGAMKYCKCRNQNCEDDRLHCHFYCEKCKKTYCIDHLTSPNVTIPKGFVTHQINYIVKGVCDKCSP